MKIYRKKDYEQQVDGYRIEEKDDGTCSDNNQQSNYNHTGTIGETRFVARVMTLPLLQEGLSSTQSMASQFKVGRVLLDRTHSMIQHFTHTMHRAQETPTYQHYFRQQGYLQRSLIKVDGWACSSLDIIETRVPLLHQPVAALVDTLIIQPQQQLKSSLNCTWDLVITQPLARLNGTINKDLDEVEHWIRRRRRGLNAGSDDSQGTNMNQRILFLGGYVFDLGLDQAMMTKEWLFSQDVFPLARSIKSRFGAFLPDWNYGTRLTTKSEPTY